MLGYLTCVAYERPIQCSGGFSQYMSLNYLSRHYSLPNLASELHVNRPTITKKLGVSGIGRLLFLVTSLF